MTKKKKARSIFGMRHRREQQRARPLHENNSPLHEDNRLANQSKRRGGVR
jgi:hypothetical protein